ncbi:hypothetical protein BCT12_11480 [Vibrio breoganii]|nr:hypothetical protein BCT12_11480 [Vibrio breoganii]
MLTALEIEKKDCQIPHCETKDVFRILFFELIYPINGKGKRKNGENKEIVKEMELIKYTIGALKSSMNA